MNAKTQNEDGMEAWANSQADRDDMMKNETLKASSECPVCGVNTPHPHSQDDLVARIREFKVRIINAVHLLDAGATKEQVRCHLSSINADQLTTEQINAEGGNNGKV